MDISGIGSTYGSSSSDTAVQSSSELGSDEFMQLFITQLQAQDPLNPMDSAAFTSQLAEFSSLEQLTNINTQLEDMLMFQSSLQNTLTTTLIGKQVQTVNDDAVHTITGMLFENNATYLELEDGSRIQMGDITAILGGA